MNTSVFPLSLLPLFAPPKTDVDDMPGLLRRLVVVAAVDGLILQTPGNGLRSNGNNEPSCIRIDYRTSKISFLPASAVEQHDRDLGLEAYGLVGKGDSNIF